MFADFLRSIGRGAESFFLTIKKTFSDLYQYLNSDPDLANGIMFLLCVICILLIAAIPFTDWLSDRRKIRGSANEKRFYFNERPNGNGTKIHRNNPKDI